MRVCGLCGAEYGEGDQFCAVDGSPLRTTAPSPSERILADRYQLKWKIGSGGFGVVLEAEDLRLRKRVAVKLLGPRVASNPEALARFEREAMAAARIGHKGIIDVTDFERDANGVPFLVMEHLDGADLSTVLASEKTLTVPRSLRIALQIAHALDAAHAHGIVHRDLKPSNIFLTNFGVIHDVVKILDFGIARAAAPNEASRLTGQWQIIGTPEYMAPEQAENPLDLDHRADIYALGCILYKLLVGRPPYVASTRMDLLRAHAQERPVPPSVADPSLPAEFDDLVLRALAKDPAYRYPNMRSFAEAIRTRQGEDAATPPMGFPAALRGSEDDTLQTSSTLGVATGEVLPSEGLPRAEQGSPTTRRASEGDTLQQTFSTLGVATGEILPSEGLPRAEQLPRVEPAAAPTLPAPRTHKRKTVAIALGLASIALGLGVYVFLVRSPTSRPQMSHAPTSVSNARGAAEDEPPTPAAGDNAQGPPPLDANQPAGEATSPAEKVGPRAYAGCPKPEAARARRVAVTYLTPDKPYALRDEMTKWFETVDRSKVDVYLLDFPGRGHRVSFELSDRWPEWRPAAAASVGNAELCENVGAMLVKQRIGSPDRIHSCSYNPNGCYEFDFFQQRKVTKEELLGTLSQVLNEPDKYDRMQGWMFQWKRSWFRFIGGEGARRLGTDIRHGMALHWDWGTGTIVNGVSDYVGFEADGEFPLSARTRACFQVGADDLVKLTIDGRELDRDWSEHRYRLRPWQCVDLEPGTHKIRLVYRELTKHAEVSLSCKNLPMCSLRAPR